MLTKRKTTQSNRPNLQSAMAGLGAAVGSETLDRRSFLRRSGLTVGGLAAAGAFQLGSIRKAEAISPPQPGVPIEIKKNICTHCSVGCTVTAEVQNGVWTGQEPSWASPINRGAHCAKG
ncbi:MAG: twin-arginine translocation signal domain-containing protein, partial [Pseudomonadota bacterium]|nr:twin-arginine translocation signal domain-containing protein [Pseudomonadota bacterium]